VHRTADGTERGAPRAGVRVVVAFGIGAAAFAAAIAGTPWQVAITVAWIAASIVYLVWVWAGVHGVDAERTAELATAEDRSRIAADALVVASSGASLVGVALALLEASAERGTAGDVIIAVSGVCLLLSWTTVNTVYTLRYASRYYADRDRPGGIRFGEGTDAPTYADFAYLAFTIGMTYQVSDTPLTTRLIRRTALGHALLSFVFVTSVIAMTINIVGQLLTR
jgi:uncharacterized membrane protein